MVRYFVLAMFLAGPQAQANVRAYFPSTGKPQAVIDGRSYSMKWYQGRLDLGDALASNSESQKLYEQYIVAKRWASGFAWTALAGALTYLIVNIDDDQIDTGTLALISGVPGAVAKAINNNANTKLDKAFNIYNGVPSQQASASTASDGFKLTMLSYSF